MNTQVEDSKSVSFADLEYLIEQKNNAEFTTILSATPSLMSIVDKDSARSLLHAATMHTNLAIVEYLLKGGCDIEAKTSNGLTPLIIAVNSDDPLLVKMLLDFNADMFVTNSDGRTALEVCSANRSLKYRIDILKAFCEKVKTKYSNNNGELFVIFRKFESPLKTIVHLRNAQLTKIFLGRQNHIEQDLRCSIFDCMQCNYEENLRALLQHGLNVQRNRACFLGYFQLIASRPQFTYCLLSEIIGMFVRVLIDLNYLDRQGAHKVCGLFSVSTEEVLCELLKTELNSVMNELFFEKITE